MPRMKACGNRQAAYDDFKTAHDKARAGDFIAHLVDSEDPVSDIHKTWQHLWTRDDWQRPPGSEDNQVLLMTTSMETWIMADPKALREMFGRHFDESKILPLDGLERRSRHEVLNALQRATNGRYQKGKVAFAALAKVNPTVLAEILPSFQRARQILDAKIN